MVSMEKDGMIYCISLIKVEELEGMVKSVLGPLWMKFLRNNARLATRKASSCNGGMLISKFL